jgi:hypothetical protein
MLLLSSRRKSVGDCGYLPQELWLGVFRCMHRDWVRASTDDPLMASDDHMHAPRLGTREPRHSEHLHAPRLGTREPRPTTRGTAPPAACKCSPRRHFISPQVREPRPTTRGTAQAEYVHERGLAVGIEAAAACHLVLAENRVEAPSRAPSGEAPSRAPSGEAPSRAPSGEAPSRAAENWVEALDGAPSRALGGEAPSRAPDGAPHDEAPYRAPDGAPYRAPDGAPHRDPNTGDTYLVRPIWNGSAWVEAPPPRAQPPPPPPPPPPPHPPPPPTTTTTMS